MRGRGSGADGEGVSEGEVARLDFIGQLLMSVAQEPQPGDVQGIAHVRDWVRLRLVAHSAVGTRPQAPHATSAKADDLLQAVREQNPPVYDGYEGCAQMECLALMAKKIVVSQSTSGDMPDSGLDVLNQSGDSVEVALAKQLLG